MTLSLVWVGFLFRELRGIQRLGLWRHRCCGQSSGRPSPELLMYFLTDSARSAKDCGAGLSSLLSRASLPSVISCHADLRAVPSESRPLSSSDSFFGFSGDSSTSS